MHSWPHIDITPFSRSVTYTFLARFFHSKDVFLNLRWDINSFFKAGLYGTCLSDQVVQISYKTLSLKLQNSQKMIIWQSKSLIIWMLWYTWVCPIYYQELIIYIKAPLYILWTLDTTIHRSEQVRYCNNMDDKYKGKFVILQAIGII